MADFPGTNRRFYPGIEFYGQLGITQGTAVQAQSMWDTYLAAKSGVWNNPGVTWLALRLVMGWGDFYTDETIEPTDPTNPNDAAYDWSIIDNVLTADCFNSSDCKLVVSFQDRWADNPHPQWFNNGGGVWSLVSTDGTAYHRQYAVDKMRQFAQAFGAKYNNEDRLMYLHIQESPRFGNTPTDFNNPTGGGTEGLTGQDAYDVGNILAKGAFAEFAPNLAVIMYNLRPLLAYGLLGYTGLIDRGMGGGYPDPRLFKGSCGTGTYPDNDCDTNDSYFILQKERGNIITQMASEPNGWAILYWEGDSPWDRANPFGLTGIDQPAITPHHFAWYCSGPPRAASPNDDSGLGQVGTDPAGVIPVSILSCVIRNEGTRTWADFSAALDVFAYSGTDAIPYFPPGYPGQGGNPDPDVATVRINCGDTSYVDPATGQQWDSDAVYTSETGTDTLGGTLVNGTGYPDSLFTKGRLDAANDNILFTIPSIENGTYTVTLGFVETYSLATVGFRVFHIDIQGNRVETDYDILDQTGALYTATTKSYSGVVVDSGTLAILLTDTAANRPHISFIEVTQQIIEAQFAAEEETSPGVYADRTTSVSPVMAGQVNIDVDKASVVDWGAVVFKVVSNQIGEQIRNVKLRTNV